VEKNATNVTNEKIFGFRAGKKKNRRISGKIFCHVDNIKHMGQFRADITVLYQF